MHRLTFRTPLTLVVALGLAAGLAACSSTQSPETQLEDSAIKTEVVGRITADPNTNPFEIEVEVNEGVVYLTGVVDEAEDRAEAERLARRVDGVSRVENRITVGDQTGGERADDAAITAQVKTKLADDMNPFNVQVNTVDGVVQLTGRVENAEERAEAERIARSVDGVRDVRNELMVGDEG